MSSCGRSPALAPIAALLAALLLAAAPTVARAGGPSHDALDSLNNLRDRLLNAKKKADGKQRRFRAELEQAHVDKVLFYLKAFEGTTFFGGCPGQKVIGLLDDIDTELEEAEHDSGKLRQRRIKRALDHAKELEKLIEGCAQGAAAGHGDLIKGPVRKLLKQEQKGKLSGKELRQGNGRLFKRKRDILEDERIQRCRVLEIFVQIERIDFLLVRAKETKPKDFKKNGKKRAEKKRRKVVERTIDQFQELYRLYVMLPCDPPAIVPPPGGGAGGGGGGGGVKPACDNGKDDDGDGTADDSGSQGVTKDEGCMSPQDTTEGHTPWPVTLPGDGGSTISYTTFKPGFGAEPPPNVVRYGVFYNPTLHDTMTVNHGALPINGTNPCGSGASMEISAGIGSQAPTIGGEPTPDENEMRIVLETTDSPTGDPCPTTVDLRVVTDTR